MKLSRITLALAATGLLALPGCYETEDDIERTAESLEAETKELGRDIERGAEKAGHAIERGAEKAAHATEHALLKAGESAKDAWISAKVKSALLDRLQSDAISIDVETKDGHVTLEGNLGDADALPVAQSTARAVEGVTSVDVLIETDSEPDGEYTAEAVTAELRGQLSDARLNARVRAALLDGLGAEAAQIRLNAEGSSVIVGGEVDSEAEKAKALDIVEKTAGVTSTIDRLKVDA